MGLLFSSVKLAKIPRFDSMVVVKAVGKESVSCIAGRRSNPVKGEFGSV